MERANVLGFDTDRGYRLIELYVGDLLAGAITADVLVVSAFANDYAPTASSLIGQLKEHLGFDLASEIASPYLDLRSAFGCWVTHGLTDIGPFRHVLVAEMRGDSRRPLDAVNHSFATLAALDATGVEVESVAMPVLGTGDQGLSPDSVMPILLRESEAALRRHHSLQRVVFVECDNQRAAALSEAMDSALGRVGVSLPKTDVISSLKRDLEDAIAGVFDLAGDRQRVLLQETHRLTTEASHASYEVGVVARRLVEVVADDVLNGSNRDSLARRIEALGQYGVAPWIRGYMHTLGHLGNESVHESSRQDRYPPHIANDDLTIALFCMLRILWFWRDYRVHSSADT